MTKYGLGALAVVGLVALVLLGFACTRLGSQTTTPATTTTGNQSGSSITSGSSTTKPAVSTADITTPVTGSTERKALLDAARTRFSTTSEFYVHQLFVQGDTAIGDIAPVSGGGERAFVAWANGPQWTVVWTEPFGSSKASATGAAAALPSFSTKLLDKVAWTLAKPASAEIAAKQASLAAEAKKWSKSTMNSAGQPYKVTLNKVAMDVHGVWWGHIVTQPTTDAKGSYEPLNYWAKYGGGVWKGSVQDPEPPPAQSYFPASVIPELDL